VAKQVVRGNGGAESARAGQGSVRRRDSLFHWCSTADAIRQAKERGEKRTLLNAYFGVVAVETVAPAARFFAGLVHPTHDAYRRSVDASIVSAAIREITGLNREKLRALVAKCGDLGDAAAELFSGRLPSGLSVSEVSERLDEMATVSPLDAPSLTRDILARLSSLEVKYVVKLLTGVLQLGVEPADIEAAQARGRAVKVKR
jgi:hypothetical protein